MNLVIYNLRVGASEIVRKIKETYTQFGTALSVSLNHNTAFFAQTYHLTENKLCQLGL